MGSYFFEVPIFLALGSLIVHPAVAGYLHCGGGKHRACEPHIGFGNLHANRFDLLMLRENGCGYSLRYRLDQVYWFTLYDLFCPPVNLRVVDRLREVIRVSGGLQVAEKLHADHEALPQLPLCRERPMPPEEDHAFERNLVVRPFTHLEATCPLWCCPSYFVSRHADYNSDEHRTLQGRRAKRVGRGRRKLLERAGTDTGAPRNGPRPSVTVSYAQTLDGRLATSTGSSQWISAPESLSFAHKLRANHDAILVGAGTACRDNPRLTVRLAPGKNPLRVVVDSTFRTPLDAAVFADGAATGTVLAVTERAPAERCARAEALGARVMRLPDDTGRVDLSALLDTLGGIGVRSVMAEGGASIITALFKSRLVDRAVVCIAPKILGSGIEAVGDLGIHDLGLSIVMEDFSLTRQGCDLILDGLISYPGFSGRKGDRKYDAV